MIEVISFVPEDNIYCTINLSFYLPVPLTWDIKKCGLADHDDDFNNDASDHHAKLTA